MISYYPNAGHLNEAFDKAVAYKEGDADAEVQAVYELCAKIYKVGFMDGVDKMTANTIKMLREMGYAQDTDRT